MSSVSNDQDYSVAALIKDVVGGYIGPRQYTDGVLEMTGRLRRAGIRATVEFFAERTVNGEKMKEVWSAKFTAADNIADPAFGAAYILRRWSENGFATAVGFTSSDDMSLWLRKMLHNFHARGPTDDQVELDLVLKDRQQRKKIFQRELSVGGRRRLYEEYPDGNDIELDMDEEELTESLKQCLGQLKTYVRV